MCHFDSQHFYCGHNEYEVKECKLINKMLTYSWTVLTISGVSNVVTSAWASPVAIETTFLAILRPEKKLIQNQNIPSLILII